MCASVTYSMSRISGDRINWCWFWFDGVSVSHRYTQSQSLSTIAVNVSMFNEHCLLKYISTKAINSVITCNDTTTEHQAKKQLFRMQSSSKMIANQIYGVV